MVEYTLRENPRARRINVTVRRDGTVWVTKPRRVPKRDVDRFVEKCGEWILRAQQQFSKLPKTTRIESSKKEHEKYKGVAYAFVAQRIAHFNSFYKVRFSKISIRNQKSRWGSCSRNGVLSFNYRILFLPPHLADYIVAHELCHLVEMNHSKQFWDLVSVMMPDHRDYRRELRRVERGIFNAS